MKLSLKSLFSINPTSITFCAILLLVILFSSGTRIFDMVELKTYDLRFLSRGSLQPSPAIILALIDEKSLDQEGRWPWPRSKIARLVDTLSQGGAKVIGFDIGFLEPDENSELRLIDQLGKKIYSLHIKNDILTRFISERKRSADNDLALASAIKNSSADIVLGYFFHMNEAELDYHLEPTQIDQLLKRISASRYPLIYYQNQSAEDLPFVEAYAPEASLEIFSEAADSSGYYNVKSDQDGVVRSMPLIIQCGKDIFPPLALSCAWFYLDKPQLTVMVANYGVEGIKMGERLIPTDEKGHLLINYLGPPKTFPHFSISDILRGKVPQQNFKDKIVLVGATAMGTHDLRSTPVSLLYPGVEINATVIDNILTRSFITKPNWSKVYDLFAIIMLATLTGLALPRLNAVTGFLFLTGLFALQIFLSNLLFINYHIWLNMVYPLLALSMTYTALTVYRYFTEERERKKIKNTFRHYVSPIVIEEMLRSPDRLKLGGEEKVLTVLFSDLQGFTSCSEHYKPHEMIDILSEYYEKMTEQIF
ncbi:MAG: CHASE2 domain-containing protein, partial [Desulfoferrobacter sp.]